MTGDTIVRKNPGIYNNKEQAFQNAVLHNPRAAQKTNVQLNLLASQTNTKIRGSTLTESISLQLKTQLQTTYPYQ